MQVLLFTILNCVACNAHRKELTTLSREFGFDLRVFDVDDPNNFHLVLKAMQKHDLMKTPSLVLLDENREPLLTLQGIPNSIETLKRKLYEERH